MELDSIQTELPFHIKNANTVKEIILAQLLKDSKISEEDFNNYCLNYQIIVFKRSWFETWFKKFFNSKEDEYQFKLVKFEN